MASEPGVEPPAPDDPPAGEPEEPAVDLEEGDPPKFTEQKPVEVKTSIEKVRAQVARALVAILAVVIFFSFLTLWMVSPPPGLADLEKVLTIIFGPLIALVSGAVGYYFGGKSGGDG